MEQHMNIMKMETLLGETYYIHGKQRGIPKNIIQDGKLAKELNYENGFEQGSVISYHPNGNISEKLTIFMGKKKGYGQHIIQMETLIIR